MDEFISNALATLKSANPEVETSDRTYTQICCSGELVCTIYHDPKRVDLELPWKQYTDQEFSPEFLSFIKAAEKAGYSIDRN